MKKTTKKLINKNKKKKISIKNKKKGGCFFISGIVPSNIAEKRDQIRNFIWNNLLDEQKRSLFGTRNSPFGIGNNDLPPGPGAIAVIPDYKYGLYLSDRFKTFINTYNCNDHYNPFFDRLQIQSTFLTLGVNYVIGGNKVLNFWECFKTQSFKALVNFNELNLIRFRRHEIKQVFGSFVR